MNRVSAAYLIIAIACGLVASCRPAAAPVAISNRAVSINDRPVSGNVAASKPFTEMSWTDEAGHVQKVGDLAGKAVILDFWATYCGPCREEIPHLNSLLAKHGGELSIVGLNVGGAEDKPEIPKFIKQTRLDYPIAWPETALNDFVFAQQDDIPQTLVLDRQGRIVDKFVGFGPSIQKNLDAAVERALASN